MAVDIHVTYEGGLRCTAKHGPSGSTFSTDAPADNQGQGQSFSPTDLVPTALATCILTTIAISMQKHGVELTGMTVHVEKHMIADPHRRIARLPVKVTMCGGVPEKFRDRIVKTAHTCPVHRSLGADVDAPIEFVWID